jgi:DNA-binding MarR family transcriptional regulator
MVGVEGGKLARRLLLLRSWERQNMPMAGSTIAGDIVLLALARDDGDAARVKDFHLSLHYSEDRVSQVLKVLVHDGWLVMERDEADRRMRKVYASDQLRLLFDEYQRFLVDLLISVEPTRTADFGAV